MKGSANALYDKWVDICKESVKNGKFKEFRHNLRGIVEDFDKLPLIPGLTKPKVGVVGEILVKFLPMPLRALSFTAESRERMRMRAAPRLFTSSIFKTV